MAEIIKVVLDAGHGGSDPGAVANNIRESEANLVVAKVARDHLLKLLPRAQVYLTRDKDIALTETQRLNAIRAADPHVVVSIHHNSAGNTAARGVEVFHAINDRRDDLLAQLLVEKISRTGIPSRGIKTRTTSSGEDYYYIIRKVMDKNTVSVLSEGAFLTSGADAALIKSGWLEQQGKAIAEAVNEYLKQVMPEAYGIASGVLPPPIPTSVVPALLHDEVTGKTHGTYIINGVTYAPVRAVAEACGLRVNYDSKTKQTTLKKAR